MQEEVTVGAGDTLGRRQGLWSAHSANHLQSPLLPRCSERFLTIKDAEEEPWLLPVDANPMAKKLRRACKMSIFKNAEIPLRILLSIMHKSG